MYPEQFIGLELTFVKYSWSLSSGRKLQMSGASTGRKLLDISVQGTSSFSLSVSFCFDIFLPLLCMNLDVDKTLLYIPRASQCMKGVKLRCQQERTSSRTAHYLQL